MPSNTSTGSPVLAAAVGGGSGVGAGVGGAVGGQDGGDKVAPARPHHHHRHTCKKHKDRVQERALRDATTVEVDAKAGRPSQTNYEPIEVPEPESSVPRTRSRAPVALPARPSRPEPRLAAEELRQVRAESRLAEEQTRPTSQPARPATGAAKPGKTTPERPPGPPVEQLWPKHWGGRQQLTNPTPKCVT